MMKKLIKKYFKPDKSFKDVSEIDLEELKKEGIKGLIIDLDDTLVPSDKKIPIEFINSWLMKSKKEFNVFILSNNSKPQYVQAFCDKFELPFIARAMKPRSKFLNQAIKKMNLNKQEVVIIGDRITTDILGGKILGIKAFLVKPLTQMPSKIQKLIYKIEAFLLNITESTI